MAIFACVNIDAVVDGKRIKSGGHRARFGPVIWNIYPTLNHHQITSSRFAIGIP